MLPSPHMGPESPKFLGALGAMNFQVLALANMWQLREPDVLDLVTPTAARPSLRPSTG